MDAQQVVKMRRINEAANKTLTWKTRWNTAMRSTC